jgi:hypothetical protein
MLFVKGQIIKVTKEEEVRRWTTASDFVLKLGVNNVSFQSSDIHVSFKITL